MQKFLTLDQISDLIGIDSDQIYSTISRDRAELENYLQNSDGTLRMEIDGLPILITKLTFNIPTNELVENLSRQILNLINLRDENQKLRKEIDELKIENRKLETDLETAESRVNLHNIFKKRK